MSKLQQTTHTVLDTLQCDQRCDEGQEEAVQAAAEQALAQHGATVFKHVVYLNSQDAMRRTMTSLGYVLGDEIKPS